jgi:hypothetical protein
MVLTLVASLVSAQSALAYIDPNTGGMLFQLLAVIFASLSAILLFFSRQIRTFAARAVRSLRGMFGGKQESDDPNPPPASDVNG